ncbi:hypothetical protein KI387_019960, partial [Taxus chinensis]
MITPKRAIGMSPFQVVYGVEAQLLVIVELPALHLMKAIEDTSFNDSLDKRIMYLYKLNEDRLKVADRISAHQQKVKALFDKRARPGILKLEISFYYGIKDMNLVVALTSLILFGLDLSRSGTSL